MSPRLIACFAGLLVFATGVARAEVLTLTVESTAAKDGHVRVQTAIKNEEGGEALRIGDDEQDRQFKAVVSFDTVLPPLLPISSELALGQHHGQDRRTASRD